LPKKKTLSRIIIKSFELTPQGAGAAPRVARGAMPPHLRLPPHLGSTKKIENFLYNYIIATVFKELTQSIAAHLTVLSVDPTSAIA